MKPARGTYRYRRDGRLQDVVEPWQVTAEGDALVLKGRRIAGATPLLDVTARYRDGCCAELELAWRPRAPQARAARYRLDGARLDWDETAAGSRRQELPEGALLFPLLRAATGSLLPQLAAAPRCVVLPDIRDPGDTGFLHPLQSRRHAAAGGQGPRHYRYYGGEYGETGADYWLDADGFVARYRWAAPDGTWEVELER